MIAPPELTLDGASESEEYSEGDDATAESAALREASDRDEGSDAEDVFAVSACGSCNVEKGCERHFRHRWLQAVQELRGHLRDEVLLPLHPEH